MSLLIDAALGGQHHIHARFEHLAAFLLPELGGLMSKGIVGISERISCLLDETELILYRSLILFVLGLEQCDAICNCFYLALNVHPKGVNRFPLSYFVAELSQAFDVLAEVSHVPGHDGRDIVPLLLLVCKFGVF